MTSTPEGGGEIVILRYKEGEGEAFGISYWVGGKNRKKNAVIGDSFAL